MLYDTAVPVLPTTRYLVLVSANQLYYYYYYYYYYYNYYYYYYNYYYYYYYYYYYGYYYYCLLYTSPSPRDGLLSRMPSSA